MDFYYVSDWLETSGLATKGTRDKVVLVKPGTEDTYFLKFPMFKPMRDYRPENWSEVIAYEVGTKLGFDVLRYDLAEYKGRVGCISKNMISTEDLESLIEGHQILSSYDPSYDPADQKTKHLYTFEFVCEAIKHFGFSKYINHFLRTLIFDAIIGNSDRHQSNWGIIQSINIEIVENNIGLTDRIFKRSKQEGRRYIFHFLNRPTPIYDSGCCLGREFCDDVLQQKLNSPIQFESYIRKGFAELRLNEFPKKQTHENLLHHLMLIQGGKWKTFIQQEIEKVIHKYNFNELREVVFNIDKSFPDRYRDEYGLSDVRKEFIIRVIDRRINNLKNI